jgi:hypothetical protein
MLMLILIRCWQGDGLEPNFIQLFGTPSTLKCIDAPRDTELPP